MARTTIEVTYRTIDGLQTKIENCLTKKGYRQKVEDNETVWRKGTGFLTGIKYIKIEYGDKNKLYISGWVRAIAGGEMNLEGFVGAFPKKDVLKTIQDIQNLARI